MLAFGRGCAAAPGSAAGAKRIKAKAQAEAEAAENTSDINSATASLVSELEIVPMAGASTLAALFSTFSSE